MRNSSRVVFNLVIVVVAALSFVKGYDVEAKQNLVSSAMSGWSQPDPKKGDPLPPSLIEPDQNNRSRGVNRGSNVDLNSGAGAVSGNSGQNVNENNRASSDSTSSGNRPQVPATEFGAPANDKIPDECKTMGGLIAAATGSTQLPFHLLVTGKDLPQENICEGKGTKILVLTKEHYLILCEQNKIADMYDVSIGRGGVDKRAAGDLRTPIGAYKLGKSKESSDFHRFIPVGYPTAQQAKAGYTGDSIGIHGPKRLFKCSGVLALKMDWTAGCMAVGYDNYIDDIVSWMGKFKKNPSLEVI